MTRFITSNLIISLGLAFGISLSGATVADDRGLPQDLSFSTLVTTPLAVEGLTGDESGNVYTVGRQPGAGMPCPVWRVRTDVANPTLELVGNIPAPASGQCSPSGLTFNELGNLFVAEDDKIYSLTPNASSPPTATVFAEGVDGTNGVAFDRDGNLWTGDGTTGIGRVWKISPVGEVTEVLRVQPMRNSVRVGRQARTFPPGTAANTGGGQDLVANGLIFDRRGDLFIADTARGAIWRARFGDSGNLQGGVGCDTTFTDNTLCLDNVFVAHPALEGADGIAFDRRGNIWVSANERNALVVVTRNREVFEVFRNPPDDTTKLRNGGPLEFPTSPVVLDRKVCTANSDGNRRDNSPNNDISTTGEIGGAGQPRGKISCAALARD